MATLTQGLTKAQIKKLKATLLDKAAEIQGNLDSSRAGRALIGEQTSNLEDLPVQSHEEWIFLNRNSIDVMLLREIQDALDRVEDNSYGMCMECDEDISKKRLEAIPWARHCIACQEELAAVEEEAKAAEASSRKR